MTSGRRHGDRGTRGGATPVPPPAKITPPPPPPPLLDRPRLRHRLDESLGRRLTTVVAGAGFGKTTLLAAWAAHGNCAWYGAAGNDRIFGVFARGLVDALRVRVPDLPPDIPAAVTGSQGPDGDSEEPIRSEAVAALLSEELGRRLRRDLVLLIDDVHELDSDGASARLLEALCRGAPPRLHLVLAGRADPPFRIERLRGEGHVLEIGGSQLAFSLDEVQALVDESLGEEFEPLASELYEVTGGWPAAVRLTVEALRGSPPQERKAVLDGVRRPGGPLFSYLAREVFEADASARDLIRVVAQFDKFSPGLCETLGIRGAVESIASLARRGLFLEPLPGGPNWYSLHALVRDFAREEMAPTPAEARTLHEAAARWFEVQDMTEDALRSLVTARIPTGTANLLKRRGADLISSGRIDAVLDSVQTLPAEARDGTIEKLAGEALQVRGKWEEALRCFERAAEGTPALDPGLAWRISLIHYLRGEPEAALAAYERAAPDGGNEVDTALLLAWTATTYWMLGDSEKCDELGRRALAGATSSGDPRALAVAHTVLALLAAITGDRRANDAHYVRALEYAEQAADVLQITRIRTNHASHLMEEGFYEEALAELEIAIRLADLSGFAAFQALGLVNRGETRMHLGRLDEAIADFEAAKSVYQRMNARGIAHPLSGLGDIYRQRGDFALARASYEEAVSVADAAGDVQALVPALAGLARVLVQEDTGAAARLADRAVASGPGLGYVGALLASGWVALAQGDRAAARARAEQAAAEARSRRDRAGLAAALELEAGALEERGPAAERLEEAASLWRGLGNPLGAARADVGAAAALGPRAREVAEAAERTLRALGARGAAAVAARVLADFEQQERPALSVHTLGGFRLVRQGATVPRAAWQSKKARDLLKILVSRRGRPAPREQLMDLLWPGENPAQIANRLSVALATVRSVIDPGKAFAADHFVAADNEVIGLDVSHVDIDVERFLAVAEQGLARLRSGRIDDGIEALAQAEVIYAGDFLEEDAYEDWAVPLREEARQVFIRVSRALADLAAGRGDHDAAVRHLLRVLERDEYDEGAHLALVGSLESDGRHGEARRRYRVYCQRMDEIGVESVPFPSPGTDASLKTT